MSFCSINQPLRWVCYHQSPTKVAQQSVTKIISLTIMNLVTLKGAAQHEPKFKKPASEASLFSSKLMLS